MSYASESKQVMVQEDVVNRNVQGSSDLITIHSPLRLLRVGYTVTTVIAGAMTQTITKRLIPGDDTGEVAVTTLTIPDTTVAGKVLYKDLTPIDLNPGDQIEFATTQAGAQTGAGICFIEVIPRPEVPANLSDMVASA